MDQAHRETDQRLEDMEKHLKAIYSRAGRELEKKAEAYWADFDRLDQKKRKLLAAGRITQEEYDTWRRNKILYAQRFPQLKKQLAESMLHANETALRYINDQLPDIYALNYNALQPEVEGLGGYSFTLVDPTTVKNLASKDLQLLPYKEIDPDKDIPWNMKHIQAEVLQGILQGDSIPRIASRLRTVADMNQVAAVRNARTMVTGAECRGRQDSYVQAQKDGIQIQREWISTNDGRTRHAHRLLQGATAEVDKPFDSELGPIMFPGDPEAAPANVYNCRCTIAAKILGFAKKAGAAAKQGVEKTVKTVEKAKAPIDFNVNFSAADTLKTAKAHTSGFAEKVTYGRSLTLDQANEVNETLQKLTEQFPTRKLKTIKISPSKGGYNARACYDTLEINTSSLWDNARPSNWEEIRAGAEKLVKRYTGMLGDSSIDQALVKQALSEAKADTKFYRWSHADSYPLADKAKYTVIHEYGHIIADQYIGQINGDRANHKYGVNPENPIRQLNKMVSETYERAIRDGGIYKISKYGASNEYEFFAESFACYYTGEDLPNYISDMVKEVLKYGNR